MQQQFSGSHPLERSAAAVCILLPLHSIGCNLIFTIVYSPREDDLDDEVISCCFVFGVDDNDKDD